MSKAEFRESEHPRDQDGKFAPVNSTVEIEARKIEPPHEVRDTEKLESLISSMRAEGWKGNPIPVWQGPAGTTALTGSHRIAAAQEAEIDVPVYEMEELGNFVNSEGKTIDEMHDDEEILSFLKEFGDPGAISLLEEEIAKNHEQPALADSAGHSPSKKSAIAEKPIRAAGVLFASPGDRVLLVHRTDGQGWAFPGGGIEDGENAEEAARRELLEETGIRYDGPLAQWTRRQKDGVDFTTFLAEAPEGVEFVPQLNAEHDAFEWTERSAALDKTDLHPGARIALLRSDMDELAVAEAIQSGELVSPQKFLNILLVALRITGTGASYRDSIKEYVWRDPSLYLTERFVKRCNGLPVIWEHPKGGQPLDSKEFARRIVGSVFLPYQQDEDIWAIAKIYDDEAVRQLRDETISTSPCVVFIGKDNGTKKELEDGSILLIEGYPSFLDHVCLTQLGVWDKGGPPTGVESVTALADSIQSDPKLDVALELLRDSAVASLARRLESRKASSLT